MTDDERIEKAREALRSAAKEVATAKKLLEALPAQRGAHVLGALGHVTPWLATTRREAYYASKRSPHPR